jgi:hypothetical protein
MQFTQNDLAIISNFSKISKSLYFSQGNVLRVKPFEYEHGSNNSEDKGSIYAIATLESDLPIGFGIADVGNFLGLLRTKNTDIEFHKKELHIIGANTKLKYKYASEFYVKECPIYKFPSGQVSFKLPNETLKTLKKFSSLLGLEFLTIEYDEFIKRIRLSLTNLTNQDSSNSYEVIIDDFIFEDPYTFSDTLELNIIEPMDIDYKVNVLTGKFCRFESDSNIIDVKYYYSFRNLQ